MLSTKRLYRSRRNRMIAGVAGGLADYLDIDPTIVRLGFVAAALLFHVFTIAAYVVAWLIVPDQSTLD
jgi:phage shock protein C